MITLDSMHGQTPIRVGDRIHFNTTRREISFWRGDGTLTFPNGMQHVSIPIAPVDIDAFVKFVSALAGLDVKTLHGVEDNNRFEFVRRE